MGKVLNMETPEEEKGQCPVYVNPAYMKIFPTKAAVWLSHMIGKNEYFKKQGRLELDGYFWRTRENIYEATGISKPEQTRIVQMYRRERVIVVKIQKRPKDCVYYKINFDVLEELVKIGKPIKLIKQNDATPSTKRLHAINKMMLPYQQNDAHNEYYNETTNKNKDDDSSEDEYDEPEGSSKSELKSEDKQPFMKQPKTKSEYVVKPPVYEPSLENKNVIDVWNSGPKKLRKMKLQNKSYKYACLNLILFI
jgi:hypothetical protein